MYVWKGRALLCPKEGVLRLCAKRAALPDWLAAFCQRSPAYKIESSTAMPVYTGEPSILKNNSSCYEIFIFPTDGHMLSQCRSLQKVALVLQKSTWQVISENTTEEFTLSNATVAVGP